MKTTVRTIGLTASTVLLAASWSFAQATAGATAEPEERRTAVISAQVSSRFRVGALGDASLGSVRQR